MIKSFSVSVPEGAMFIFIRHPEPCTYGEKYTPCHAWLAHRVVTDDYGYMSDIFVGQGIASDSSTRADLLELFGFDRALAKTARSI